MVVSINWGGPLVLSCLRLATKILITGAGTIRARILFGRRSYTVLWALCTGRAKTEWEKSLGLVDRCGSFPSFSSNSTLKRDKAYGQAL